MSKVNLPCVKGDGTVDFSKNATLRGWNANSSMEFALIALKNEMIANKKAAQPADGEMY